ncbi:hypothetical protein NPIL_324641 [Nephila pilipes]|uniref:Uncharacterized protein n=1 Tax=Nephila pilipes TaxID=299642 RepID=A0A8X6I8I0_NEPPI|nr:hypothetical protein NPIL_324641 [Nephila pilipes]
MHVMYKTLFEMLKLEKKKEQERKERSKKKVSKRFEEACCDSVLPHRRVARKVKAFRSGLNETADLYHTGRPSIPQHQIDIVKWSPFSILSMDCSRIKRRSWSQASNDVAHIE